MKEHLADDDLLTISEVAARTGVAPSALRFYERRGLIRPAGRAGGKRTYVPGVIEQVAMIDLFQQAGFTLTEIARMADADGRIDPAWRQTAGAKLAELQARMADIQWASTLIEHALQCPHLTLDQCPTFRASLSVHADVLATRVETSREVAAPGWHTGSEAGSTPARRPVT